MKQMDVFRQDLHKIASEAFPEKIFVYGEGKINGRICMIGEAPGGDEERQGHPFVGKAGKNLSEFLKIVGLERHEIYISNVVKLRPIRISPKTGNPVNRPPNQKEISFFLPYLLQEIQLVQAELIVTLGNVPLKAVMQDNHRSIGDCHGTLLTTPEGQMLFPLYHPAAIIYNRSLSTVYEQDLQKLKHFLDSKKLPQNFA